LCGSAQSSVGFGRQAGEVRGGATIEHTPSPLRTCALRIQFNSNVISKLATRARIRPVPPRWHPAETDTLSNVLVLMYRGAVVPHGRACGRAAA
jgi:hypothetical protein